MVDTYRNILVAIDSSKKAEKAFLETVTIAERNQTTLRVLYINEVIGNYFGDFAFVTTSLQEELDEVAESQMREHRSLVIRKGLADIEIYVPYGHPRTLIANFHEPRKSIGLIVVGATGLNAIERVLVGSVTSYVVDHTSCNVMIVK